MDTGVRRLSRDLECSKLFSKITREVLFRDSSVRPKPEAFLVDDFLVTLSVRSSDPFQLDAFAVGVVKILREFDWSGFPFAAEAWADRDALRYAQLLISLSVFHVGQPCAALLVLHLKKKKFDLLPHVFDHLFSVVQVQPHAEARERLHRDFVAPLEDVDDGLDRFVTFFGLFRRVISVRGGSWIFGCFELSFLIRSEGIFFHDCMCHFFVQAILELRFHEPLCTATKESAYSGTIGPLFKHLPAKPLAEMFVRCGGVFLSCHKWFARLLDVLACISAPHTIVFLHALGRYELYVDAFERILRKSARLHFVYALLRIRSAISKGDAAVRDEWMSALVTSLHAKTQHLPCEDLAMEVDASDHLNIRFFLDDVEINLGDGRCLPKSTLNKVRRQSKRVNRARNATSQETFSSFDASRHEAAEEAEKRRVAELERERRASLAALRKEKAAARVRGAFAQNLLNDLASCSLADGDAQQGAPVQAVRT